MPKFCRQPDHALHRAAVPRPLRGRRATRASRRVEYLFPYAVPEGGSRRARSHANGLKQVLHNLPAGNWEAGERGIACLPGPRGRVPRRRGARDRLCEGAGLPAAQLPRRQAAGGRRPRARCAQTLVEQPALRGGRAEGAQASAC